MVDGMASFREPSPLTPAARALANSELRNTDVFLVPLTLFFSNFTLGMRPSLLVFVPIALTLHSSLFGQQFLGGGIPVQDSILSLKC